MDGHAERPVQARQLVGVGHASDLHSLHTPLVATEGEAAQQLAVRQGSARGPEAVPLDLHVDRAAGEGPPCGFRDALGGGDEGGPVGFVGVEAIRAQPDRELSKERNHRVLLCVFGWPLHPHPTDVEWDARASHGDGWDEGASRWWYRRDTGGD